MQRTENRLFSKKHGLPPGSLIETTAENPIRLCHIRYSETMIEKKEYDSPEDFPSMNETGVVDWIQVYGIEDSHVLTELGNRFGLHKLTLEDIQNTDRRLGFDDQEDYLFFTLKRLSISEKEEFSRAETVSLILKDSIIFTFHLNTSDGCQVIETRLRNKQGRIRRAGAPYLAYSIIDESIDTWLSYSETIENGLLEIEERILFNYKKEQVLEIHKWKKHLAWLRWLFRPYRDLNAWMKHDGSKWFPEDVHPYLSDVSDHVIRVLDTLELYRDMAEDLLTIHMTAISNRMNSVMKMLTIISTIFIPLTFLAGIYGMNFENMPELAWKWGYPAVVGLMFLISGVMLIFFKRRKWL